RIHDDHRAKTFTRELAEKSLGIGVPLGTKRKDSVPVHITDVEPQGVARDPATSILLCQPENVAIGIVVPAALMMSERPQGGRGHAPGERGVSLENRTHARSGEDILGVLAPRKFERNSIALRKIECPLVAIVDEEPGHAAKRVVGGRVIKK